MKLYGAIASPYVARVLMYAKIKGIDLPLSEAAGGNIKSPEYLKLNPIGKMPTLDVDGKGIGESTIICDYLDDVYPQKSGLPADPYRPGPQPAHRPHRRPVHRPARRPVVPADEPGHARPGRRGSTRARRSPRPMATPSTRWAAARSASAPRQHWATAR